MRIVSKQSFILLLLAGVTAVLYRVVPYDSALVESLYFNGIYRSLRWLWAYSLALSPIALIYPAVFLLLFFLSSGVYRLVRTRTPLVDKLSGIINTLIQAGCLAYILFYWLWGFNYKRPDFLSELAATNQEITEDYLFGELSTVVDSLASLRPSLRDDLGLFTYNSAVEKQLSLDLEDVFKTMNMPLSGPVRVRKLYPRGSLLLWSTAGVYLPFVAEGHLDPGLHGITWPFTISHEMAHGYGITNEDSCNLWAFLSCVNSAQTVHRYSGYFGYWRYLLSNARLANPSRFESFWMTVPQILKDDLAEVWEYSGRYPELLPALRDVIYDNYLKSHGIEEGLRSYSRMITLVHAWRQTYGTVDLSRVGKSE